ncbi:MAG: glycosyltransferase family 2 protein, partial [Candidatus Methylomirabilis sp.]|nr:glycosyltransferase family 2 protein [Deltaproteobacteria bacterium]
MPNKLVSLCVLNTNERHFLEKAIPLMLGQTYQPLELIVVDNASEDGSAEWIERNYPEIVLLRNEKNLFYCKSHNKGIAAAKGEYVMLLNSDIFMTPTFVEEQVRAMEADPKVGLCQGKLVQIKREEEPVETRTLGKTLDSCGVGMDVLLRVQDYGFAREDKGQYNVKAHVFAACGAVPLYTRAFIEDIACEGEVLDEDYEIYGEDLDIGWRAQLLGWRVLYVPTAVAYHFRGLKTLAKPTPEPIKRYMQGLAHKNRYLIIAKNATWRQLVPWGVA